jgi:small subunit ribosomal protein S17
MSEQATKESRGLRKVRTGVVLSDAQDKTVVVRVDLKAAHPIYKKIITRSKKYHVHDQNNEAHTGDIVQIAETRPLSKLKRWRLVEVLRRAAQEI